MSHKMERFFFKNHYPTSFYIRHVYIVIFHILLPPDFKRGIPPCYLMINSLVTEGLYLHRIWYTTVIIIVLCHKDYKYNHYKHNHGDIFR